MNTASYVQRFLLEDLDIRGAIVRLGDVWQAMLAGRDYPAPVRNLLGEMSAVVGVIANNLKQTGRLTIQIQGHGPVSLLVVDCNEALNLRGYAKHAPEASTGAAGSTAIGQLVGDGHLLMTLDIEALERPYQSYVPIEGDSVAQVFENYLTQSEQLPSALQTACDAGAAACLFLQKLPGADQKDADGWDRITRLASTLRADELLGLEPEEILTRLFHQETVRVFEAREITHHWPMDWARIHEMLRGLGQAEAEQIIAEHGEIVIRDDLSNHEYRVKADDLPSIFNSMQANAPTLH